MMPILIKNIGTSLYGGYVLLITGIGFISAISTFGVGFNFKRFIPSSENKTERSELFYPQLVFQFISIITIAVLLIITQGFIKTTIFKGQLDFSIYLVVGILVCNVLYSNSADFFRYTHRMKFFSLATTLQPYLMILFVVVSIYIFSNKTLNFLLLAYLSTLIIISVPFFGKVLKETGFRFPALRLKSIVGDIRLGFPLVLSYVVDFILNGSDKYVIAFFMSTADVGNYSPAYRLGSLIVLVPKVFSGGVLLPLLSHAADKGNDNKAKSLVNYVLKIFFLVCFPFIMGSIFLSKPILILLANRQVADSSWFIVPVVALGILFYGLNLILSDMLFVRMKTKVIFSVNAISAVLNLILNVIFIYIFRSILIAAVTTFVSYLVSFIILNAKTKKDISVNYNIAFILKCLASSVLMGIALYYIRPILGTGARNILLSLIAGCIVYMIFIFVFKTFDAKEVNFIRNNITSAFSRKNLG